MSLPGEQITGFGLVLSGSRTDPEMDRLLRQQREQADRGPHCDSLTAREERRGKLREQGFYPDDDQAMAETVQGIARTDLEVAFAVGSLMPVEINLL